MLDKPIAKHKIKSELSPVAQLYIVSDSDSEGRRFDSCRVYQPTLCTNRKGFCFPPPLVSPFADAIDASRNNRYSVAALLTTPVGCTKQASVFPEACFHCAAMRGFADGHPLLPALGVRKCSALAYALSCQRVYHT